MESTHAISAKKNRSPKGGRHPLAEIASIVLFALSVFAVFALFTYNPEDPSIFSNSHAHATNACGKIGAELAAILIQCFGLGAFLLPAALFFMAMTVFKREGGVRVVGTLAGMSTAVVSFAVFLTLQWKYWPFSGNLILTGGAFGVWLADLLMKQLNWIGSSLVSLLIFCLAVAISTPVSVSRAGAAVLGFLGKWGWKLTKLVATYLLFLAGLLAMRFAHSAGDFLQRLMEAGIRRARERAAAVRAKREEAAPKAELLPPSSENEPAHEPSINAMSADTAEAEPELITSSPLEDAPEEISMITMSQLRESSNADQGPAILPSTQTNATDKATEKLARAASRAKRGSWKLPVIDFLSKPPKIEMSVDRERLIQNSNILQQKFRDFGIDGEVTAVRPGPVITLYEFKPGPGVKVSRIAALADDLSMALSAQSVRILAPLPGKSVVGIEIPSEKRETVYMREFLQNDDFYGHKHAIPLIMGKDIGGQTNLADLARMPHLLCAGQTGSGKSVFMNSLICSLLYRFTPDELRMVLVDPKFIEFRAYQDIPHLLLPVVDDPHQASIALKWSVQEMERRYRILAKIGARNLAAFNQKVDEMGADVIRDLLFSEENQDGDETPQNPIMAKAGSDWIEAFEPDESGAPRVGKLPYIVVIIDELADLMMIARKEVEISIARIAQKARAAGIHLVIATQRPSTDVITGLIKANLPSRVSFQLASYVDSKTILDRAGAERLLGNGDMLFIPPGISQTVRLHGAYMSDEEIGKITAFLKSQGKPVYRDEILLAGEDEESGEDGDEDRDEMFDEAVELVKRSGHASASFLQRHLKVGYNRAARMIETMEARGIVGPADGARPREVLIR